MGNKKALFGIAVAGLALTLLLRRKKKEEVPPEPTLPVIVITWK